MLGDDRAKRFITDFCRQWLRLSEIDATTPDKSLYPEFDELLQRSMIEAVSYTHLTLPTIYSV